MRKAQGGGGGADQVRGPYPEVGCKLIEGALEENKKNETSHLYCLRRPFRAGSETSVWGELDHYSGGWLEYKHAHKNPAKKWVEGDYIL